MTNQQNNMNTPFQVPTGEGEGENQPNKQQKITNNPIMNVDTDFSDLLNENLGQTDNHNVQMHEEESDEEHDSEEMAEDHLRKIDFLNQDGNVDYETKEMISQQKAFLENIPKSDKMLLHIYARNIEITDVILQYLQAVSRLRNEKIDLSVVNMTAALYSHPPIQSTDSSQFLTIYDGRLDLDPLAFDKVSARDRSFKFLPGNLLSLLSFYRTRQWGISLTKNQQNGSYTVKLEVGGETHESVLELRNGHVFLRTTRSTIFTGMDFSDYLTDHPSYLSTDIFLTKIPVLPVVNSAFFSTSEWNELYFPFQAHTTNYSIAPLSNSVFQFYNNFRVALRSQFKDISIDRCTDLGGLARVLIGRMANARYDAEREYSIFVHRMKANNNYVIGAERTLNIANQTLRSDEDTQKKNIQKVIYLLAPMLQLNTFLSLFYEKVSVSSLIKARSGSATLNEAIYAFGRIRATISRMTTHISGLPGSEPITVFTSAQSSFRKAKATKKLDSLLDFAKEKGLKHFHLAPANAFQDRDFSKNEDIFLFAKKTDKPNRRFVNSTQTISRIVKDLVQTSKISNEVSVHFWLVTQNGSFSHTDVHIFFNELSFECDDGKLLGRISFIFHGVPESFGIGSNFIVPYAPKTSARISSRNAECVNAFHFEGILSLTFKFLVDEKTGKLINCGSNTPETSKNAFMALMKYIEVFKDYVSCAFKKFAQHHDEKFLDELMGLVDYLPGPKISTILEDEDDQARQLLNDYLEADDQLDMEAIHSLQPDEG